MDAGSAIDDRGATRRPLVRKRTSERSSAPTPPPVDVAPMMLPPPPPRVPSFASCVPLEMEEPAHGAPLPRGMPPLDAMRTSEPGRSRLDTSEGVDCESACLHLSRSEERSSPHARTRSVV